MAALGTSAVLAADSRAQTMGIAPAHAATSPAATYTLGISLAHDEFNRTGSTLGSAFVGGRWETASPTGLLRLQNGAAHVERLRHAGPNHTRLAAGGVSAQRASVRVVRVQPDLSRPLRHVPPHRGASAGQRRRVRDVGSGPRQRSASRSAWPHEHSASPPRRRSGGRHANLQQVLNMQTRVVGNRPVHVVARAWVAGTSTGLADRVHRRESCGYHVARCGRRQRLDGSHRRGAVGHADSLPHSAIGGTGDHGGPGSCRVAVTPEPADPGSEVASAEGHAGEPQHEQDPEHDPPEVDERE